MNAWHDRVGDLTLFEALTGGAFNRQNFFKKVKCPGVCPGGGGAWAVLELTGTLRDIKLKALVKNRNLLSCIIALEFLSLT